MTQDPNPHEALASIRTAREEFPGAVDYPIYFDLLYGGVCALLVSAQGMPQPWSFIALPVALGGLAVMVMGWRKRFGWWVSGYSPKRARWVAFGLMAVLLGLIALSLYGRGAGPDWLYLVSGALGFVAAIAGSRLWMHVWRKELKEGAA